MQRIARGAVASACSCALASLALAAKAQDGAEPRGTLRVEVTGSRIPRVDGETALPVQVITADEIARAGWTTVAELMASVPANFNGRNDALSVGAGANAGLSSANLRGLGGGNTLVLLNGRRIANYAFASGAVDLASIPLAALDRVEILKDGASSIYGTDAIAGVINFITRKDYRGVDLSAQAAVTQHGGGDHYQATVTAGFGDLAKDRFNAFVTVDWQKDTVLGAIDRPFSRTAYIPEEGLTQLAFFGVVPANIVIRPGVLVNPGYATGCDPPLSLAVPITGFTGNRNLTCQFDYAPLSDILPASERWNVLARGTWQFAPGHQLFAEYLYGSRTLPLRTSPTPVSRITDPQGRPAIYPAGGLYYPTEFARANGLSGNLQVFYRTMTLGRRVNEIETSSHRALVGLEGTLGRWDYNVAYNHSENAASDTFVSGFVYGSRVIAALRTGLINPWGAFGPEGDALLEAAQVVGEVRRAKGTLDQIDARAAGELAKLPAGPLAVAFGAEARREKLYDRPADVLDSGDVEGAPAINPQDASRDAQAAFVELNVPIVRSLEAQISARYDRYSDFGSTVNPKLALRWQPMKSLLLRGSWGKGFRAPSLPDLFTPQQRGFALGYEDPARCPVTGAPEDCEVTSVFDTRVGGNPALEPEHSTQWGAGVVFEPVPAASIGVDYWNIRKTAVIGALNSDLIFDNFDVFGATNVVRRPPDAQYPGLPGPIDDIIAYNQNVGNNETSGIDVTLRLRSEPTRAGRFTFDLDGTYIIDWTEHLNGLQARAVEGAYLFAPVPRWRHYARLSWDQGPWSATLAQRFQSGYADANLNLAGEKRRVGTYSLVDLQAGYAGFLNTTIAVGIRNLFDRDPPFSNQVSQFQVGYDPNYADPRGRTYYARVGYAFR